MIIRTLLIAVAAIAWCTSLHAQDFWSPSAGPYFADVTRLLLAPDRSVYAGGKSGLFRSPNRGSAWTTIESMRGTNASIFAITPWGTMFVTDVGLLRSSDNGANWMLVNSNVATEHMTFAFARDSTMYCGSDRIYSSTNDGIAWEITAARFDSPIVSMLSLSPDSLLIVTNDGVFLSRNRGATAYKINNTPLTRPSTIALDARNNLMLLSGGAMFYSTNKGIDWTSMMDGLGNTVYGFWSMDRDRLCVHRPGTASDSISRWDASYRKWMHLGIAGAVESFVFLYPTTMIATSFLGITRSTDSRTWSISNKGLLEWSTSTIAVAPNGDVYTEADGEVHRSGDAGITWIREGAVSTVREIGITSNGSLLTGGERGKIYRTDDRKFWYSARTMANAQATRIVCATDGTAYAKVGDTTTMRSTDHGKSWHSITGTWSMSEGDTIGALELAPDGSLVVGLLSRRVMLSSDRGETWRDHPVGLVDASTLRPLDDNDLVYSERGRIMLYDDATGVHSQLSDSVFTRLTDIVVDRNRIAYIAALDGTVHRFALDRSNSMASVSSGLLTGGVRALAIHPTGYLLASTRGIQRSAAAIFSSVPSSPAPGFTVSSSASEVIVTLDVDRPTTVSIALVNGIGERVLAIDARVFGVGMNRAVLPTIGIASGAYVVELRSQGVVAAKRVMIVR